MIQNVDVKMGFLKLINKIVKNVNPNVKHAQIVNPVILVKVIIIKRENYTLIL